MSQIEDSYQDAMGKPIPAVPGPLGWLLVKMNKGAQDVYDILLSATRVNSLNI